MKDHIGEINAMVSDKTIRIRSLFCAPENVKNYTRFFLDTNFFDAIPDENGERRFFIILCSKDKIGIGAYWDELAAVVNDDGPFYHSLEGADSRLGDRLAAVLALA